MMICNLVLLLLILACYNNHYYVYISIIFPKYEALSLSVPVSV